MYRNGVLRNRRELAGKQIASRLCTRSKRGVSSILRNEYRKQRDNNANCYRQWDHQVRLAAGLAQTAKKAASPPKVNNPFPTIVSAFIGGKNSAASARGAIESRIRGIQATKSSIPLRSVRDGSNPAIGAVARVCCTASLQEYDVPHSGKGAEPGDEEKQD